ncbi:MAG: segregation/condensation protein A [Bacillota bacterium]
MSDSGDGPGESILRRLGEAAEAADEMGDEEQYLKELPVSNFVRDFVSACYEEEVDLSVQVDFAHAAADLLQRKGRMLAPVSGSEDEEEELEYEGGPEVLLAQLMEYRRYQEVAQDLSRRAEDMQKQFPRLPPEIREWEESLADIEGADLSDLVSALEKLLIDDVAEVRTIAREQVSVSECMNTIRRELTEAGGAVEFGRIFPVRRGRTLVVVTFVALLELIRAREMRVAQTERFGPIMVYQLTPGEGVADSDGTENATDGQT